MRMVSPSFVARSVQKLVLGGAVVAMAIWITGEVAERTQLGTDLAASRALLQAEVSGQFVTLGNRLDEAVRAVTLDAETVLLAEQGDVAASRRLFDLAAAGARTSPGSVAITIYGARNQPVAWVGRSEDVPDARLAGPASLFLGQSTYGLQLFRVQPVVDAADPERQIGAVVAETPLSRDGPTPMAGADFALETSMVPVSLRLQFEDTASAGPDTFIVRTSSGEPLAAVQLSDADLQASRQRIRDRRMAAELTLAALLLLLFAGPLLDWRRSTRSLPLAAGLTTGIALLLVAARALLWITTRRLGLAEPALVPAAPWAPASAVLMASPVDFLLTGLTALGLTALGTATFIEWRRAHRPGIGVVVVDRPSLGACYLAVQVVAGTAVVALLVRQATFLRSSLSQVAVDILRFAIEPGDWMRLCVVIGLLALNAAVIGLAILILRTAASPWVFTTSPIGWRLRGAAAWMLPAVALAWPGLTETPAALWPTLAAVVFTAAAAWTLHRFGAALPRGSQAQRLVVALLALTLPSVVFYPSLVDAADSARRQLVTERYAPEVLNQRPDVRLKLSQALAEIDRMEGLDALVQASELPVAGPPSTDAAFLVWSQTQLATQRLTSSVELHNPAGAMVSRFALNLPDNAQGQIWNESSCEWEMLEEVSPFFSEERRLLHAGRAICTSDAGGRRVAAGSVVVHSMLDYANLSFISAQNPYGIDAFRPGSSRAPATGRGRALRLRMESAGVVRSVDAPPPLTEEVYRRAYESRQPFWSTITRGSAAIDVYVMSDRAAIYVLGVVKPTAFGHVNTIAELVTLAFAVFVILLLAGGAANLLTSRVPMTGRALLAEVRASFYQKLFLAFVLSAVVPVLALAVVSREYMARLMYADIESEATRLANVASRVVEDVGVQMGQAAVDDNIVVWLSRVIAQDVNIFQGAELLASSERNLFASGLLPTRTPGEVFRAIVLDGRPSYVGREEAGGSSI